MAPFILTPGLQIAIAAGVALAGAAVGSFLNVAIYRLPREKSLWWPGSRCPACDNPIAPYDNVPVLSFLLLGGRCRRCRQPISWRYPFVEAANTFLWLAVLWRFGVTLEAAAYAAFLSAMIVVTGVDLDFQIIPDGISVGGAAGALTIPVILHLTGRSELWPLGIRQSFVGLAVGGGLLLAVALAYMAVTRREGLGGGDVKLMALVGALLGWPAALLTIFSASVIGVLVITPFLAATGGNRRTPVPFGPFLAGGAVFSLFFGPAIIQWYRGLLGL